MLQSITLENKKVFFFTIVHKWLFSYLDMRLNKICVWKKNWIAHFLRKMYSFKKIQITISNTKIFWIFWRVYSHTIWIIIDFSKKYSENVFIFFFLLVSYKNTMDYHALISNKNLQAFKMNVFASRECKVSKWGWNQWIFKDLLHPKPL